MSHRRGELYRNPQGGKLAGVCAGIADYFGWEVWLVRIIVVSAVLFGMPFLIFGYMACWFILDKKPIVKESHFNSKDQQHRFSANPSAHTNESIKVKARIWQAGEPPKQALHDIRRKFSLLEKQLQAIEQYVTSAEYTVSREINKL